MNSFGQILKISIFGESHGTCLGVVLDGVPSGIKLSSADMLADLSRRKALALGTTSRNEDDIPEIVSGLYSGFTTGAPLTIMFKNNDIRSEDYIDTTSHPRPSHADFVANKKYGGYNDPRGGGHFSGRLTLGLVAAGAVAKKILPVEVAINSSIIEIGGVSRNNAPDGFENIIREAMTAKDSVGGVVECCVEGVPVGWGEPFFDGVEGRLAHLLFSIPAVKGVEFGSGFEGAKFRGSQHNDPIIDADGQTLTNNAGGVVGGITNGNNLMLRVAVKPTSSIGQTQQSFNFATKRVEPLEIVGRHDACIALRMPVVVEAVTALVLADFYMLANPYSFLK